MDPMQVALRVQARCCSGVHLVSIRWCCLAGCYRQMPLLMAVHTACCVEDAVERIVGLHYNPSCP